jgi:hypothetical protein
VEMLEMKIEGALCKLTSFPLGAPVPETEKWPIISLPEL